MEFYKMHGCGNDFIILENPGNEDLSKLAIKLCDRRIGIGADGLIIVKKDPLEMIFYNQDGSKASMCGNGIRCFARYVYEKGIAKKMKFDVLTGAGKIGVEITSTNPFFVKISMGKPNYQNQMIHVSDRISSFGRILTVGKYHLTIYSFFLGTIHTVVFVDSLDAEVLNIASDICNHSLFRAKTNVNFVHILSSNSLEIKTYERGVGWTLACGTGACSSALCAHRLGLVGKEVKVHLPLGELLITIDKKENVFLEGPVVECYIGNTKECL